MCPESMRYVLVIFYNEIQQYYSVLTELRIKQ